MGIFGLLFIILPIIILFIILGIGITLVRTILRFFGFGNQSQNYGQRYTDKAPNSGENQHTQSKQTSTQNRKIIADDEGEYVDYEEVK